MQSETGRIVYRRTFKTSWSSHS